MVDVRRLDGLLDVPPAVSITGLPVLPAPTKDIRRFDTFCMAWQETSVRSHSSVGIRLRLPVPSGLEQLVELQTA